MGEFGADFGHELARELERVLPADLPRRTELLAHAVRHAELVLSANERLNLTRITTPRDVAVKHVYDSLLPWRRFIEFFPEDAAASKVAPGESGISGARLLADVGSGAGYPGILLAELLPRVRVLLIESTQKKAAFLAETAKALRLENVEVHAVRAEALLALRAVDVVTARAVGSTRDLLRLLKPARANFRRLLLYKGRVADAELELAQAAKDAEKLGQRGTITMRAALPDDAGERCVLEYSPP